MWFPSSGLLVFGLLLLPFVFAQNPTPNPTTVPSPFPTTNPSPAPTRPTANPTPAPTAYAPSGFKQTPSIPVIRLTDTTTWKRTDFCPSMTSVATGNLAIWNALKGMVISVGVEPPGQADAAFYTFNTTSGYPNAGYFYSLWNRLASAGGFTIQWVQVPAKPDGQTLADYVKQVTPAVDIHAGRFVSDTSGNRQKGLEFSAQVIDANQVFVTTFAENVADNPWSFALPFSNDLWGVIVAFLIAHGIVMWLFREPNDRFQDFIYSSVGKFVGASDCESKSVHVNALGLSFTFCCFIVLAHYTANLATFLIAVKTKSPAIASLDAANSAGAKICVQSGTASQTTLSTYYPNVLQVPQSLYASLGLATGTAHTHTLARLLVFSILYLYISISLYLYISISDLVKIEVDNSVSRLVFCCLVAFHARLLMSRICKN